MSLPDPKTCRESIDILQGVARDTKKQRHGPRITAAWFPQSWMLGVSWQDKKIWVRLGPLAVGLRVRRSHD